MTEFSQIEQKLAEYEMAKDDANRISFDEKSEQIKRNLKAQLILEFVKVGNAINAASYDLIDRREVSRKMYNLFSEQVDPDFSLSNLLNSVSRSEKTSNLFWPEETSLVDQLTPETIQQFIKVTERSKDNRQLTSFNFFILFPPISDDKIDGMIQAIQKKYNFTFKIEAEMLKCPRPDFIYPLVFPDLDIFGQVLVDGQSTKQTIENVMPTYHANGLNFQEYLYWLICLNMIRNGVPDSQSFSTVSVPKVLYDERKITDHKVEIGRVILMNDNFATFNSSPAPTNDQEVLIALNGWEDHDV